MIAGGGGGDRGLNGYRYVKSWEFTQWCGSSQIIGLRKTEALQSEQLAPAVVVLG